MLLFDTRKFDIQTYVLDPSDEAPSKIACNKFFKGDLMDFETVYNFGKQVDVLTFEIELVNLEALERLEAEGLPVYPSPKTLRKIQNKGTQKDFYAQNNIPTAPYKRFENLENLISPDGLRHTITANSFLNGIIFSAMHSTLGNESKSAA